MAGLSLCHFGDYGQKSLRPEQIEALGKVDILFLPVGGDPQKEPTVDAARAARIELLRVKWTVKKQKINTMLQRLGILLPTPALYHWNNRIFVPAQYLIHFPIYNSLLFSIRLTD